MNMKPLSVAFGFSLALAAVATPIAMAQSASPGGAQNTVLVASPQLHAALRSLWHGHLVHIRAYAVAVKNGNQAAAQQATDEVLANAKQIADAIGGFYGKPAGDQMLTLLAGHWGGVKALTDAEHAGDQAVHEKAMHDLADNATAIAKFLSGANPNWPEATLYGLLMMHVNDHETQIDQIMAGDTAAEAQTWVHMQAHMDLIADALANGIAKQFPHKVK